MRGTWNEILPDFPPGERDRCFQALRQLRRSNHGILIDGDRYASSWRESLLVPSESDTPVRSSILDVRAAVVYWKEHSPDEKKLRRGAQTFVTIRFMTRRRFAASVTRPGKGAARCAFAERTSPIGRCQRRCALRLLPDWGRFPPGVRQCVQANPLTALAINCYCPTSREVGSGAVYVGAKPDQPPLRLAFAPLGPRPDPQRAGMVIPLGKTTSSLRFAAPLLLSPRWHSARPQRKSRTI